MKTVLGKVACITGAGSGIGRATAQLLAKEGCLLALSDVDEKSLLETAESCRQLGARVSTRRVDVGERAAVYGWADAVVQEFGAANLLINNAGVAVGSTVEDLDYEDFEWLMRVNFWGVVYGTKAFLPHLKAAGDGHIVNVSSVFGLIGVPTQAAYNASKFAVKGFTEALRQELEIEDSPVGVTCVHPGGVKTNIAKSARMTKRDGLIDEGSASEFERFFRTTPEQAAADILSAVLHNRRRQLIGKDAVFIDVMQRNLPNLYQWLLVGMAKRRRTRMLGPKE